MRLADAQPEPLDARRTVLAGGQMAAIFAAIILCGTLLAAGLGYWLARHFGAWLTIPGSYLLAMILLLCVTPVLIALEFCLAAWVRGPLADGQRLSAMQRLKLYDREIDAVMRGVFWNNSLRHRARAPQPVPPLKARPVLFVHGYFCTRGVWLPLMRAAAARGYRCEAVSLEPPFRSIDDYGRTLEAAINGLLMAHDSDQVDVVAHSMGGLAMRAYLKHHADTRVRRVITLATPHHGTLLSHFGHSIATRQMQPDSLWLHNLQAGESPEVLARFVSIYSTHDNIVMPYQTAALESAENHLISGVGHTSMLYSAVVWQHVFAALQDDAQTRADTSNDDRRGQLQAV